MLLPNTLRPYRFKKVSPLHASRAGAVARKSAKGHDRGLFSSGVR